jgi:hypothetical protein
MSAPGAGVLLPEAAAHRVAAGRHHLPRLAGGLLRLPGAVQYFLAEPLQRSSYRRQCAGISSSNQPSQRGQCTAVLP